MEEHNWFNKDVSEVEKELQTDINKGLNNEQVKEKTEKYGLNELQAAKKKTLLQRFLDQFKDFSIIVLIIAAIVSGAVGIAQGEGITDTIIILIVVMTAIGFIKAIVGSDDEKLKTAFSHLITRLIVVFILLLLPMLLTFIINIVNDNIGGTVKVGANGDVFCEITK